MKEVAVRDLRNDTAGVIRLVQSGETVTITVRGKPAARLVPIRSDDRPWISKDDLIDLLAHHQADPGLRDDLRRLAGETTGELGPIR